MAVILDATVPDSPKVFTDGENTLEAAAKAQLAAQYAINAQGQATAAQVSAAFAESVSGPTYPNTGAGLAATSSGQAFAVDNGNGTVTIYLNNAGAAVAQRTLATTAALASATGATLVYYQAPGSALPRPVQAKVREVMTINDFDGVDPTGLTDSYAGIMKAINALTFGPGSGGTSDYKAGARLGVQPGKYLLSQPIQLKKMIHLFGMSSGMDVSFAPQFITAAGGTALIIHSSNSYGTGAAGTGQTGQNAAGSIIEGIGFYSTGGTPDAYGGHGIWLRAQALLRNVGVQGFAGNGFNIVASATGPGGTNANRWRIEGGRSYNNAGNGLYVDGPDVNAGLCFGLDVTGNGQWGIYDSSFLGNTYMACHASDNTAGPYHTDDPNACNVFAGCYSEGDQPGSFLIAPTIVYGGAHGAGFVAGDTSHKFIASPDSQVPTHLLSPGLQFVDTASSAFMLLGRSSHAGADGDGFLQLVDKNDLGGNAPLRLKWKAGSWYVDWAGTTTPIIEFLNGNATVANGYSRDTTAVMQQWSGQKAGIAFHKGYFLGDQRLFRATGTAPPSSGSWVQGDIIWNEQPVAGGPVGWVCVAGGTPSTWKAFGTIAA